MEIKKYQTKKKYKHVSMEIKMETKTNCPQCDHYALDI